MIFHVSCWFIWTSLLDCMKGQAVQFLPHFSIPISSRLGYLVEAGGTFAFTKISLRLFCLLYAIIGGCYKPSLRCWSWLVMALQCLAPMLCIGSSLGSYFSAKTTQFWELFFLTLNRATFVGIFFVLMDQLAFLESLLLTIIVLTHAVECPSFLDWFIFSLFWGLVIEGWKRGCLGVATWWEQVLISVCFFAV